MPAPTPNTKFLAVIESMAESTEVDPIPVLAAAVCELQENLCRLREYANGLEKRLQGLESSP